MLSTAVPAKFPLPFAASAATGYIRPIPTASQIGITPGAASLTDGFVPLNFTDPTAGGVPPFGQDMNGLLNWITLWSQWQSAGGPVGYDAAFSTAIGGYPKGAWLLAATGNTWWISLTENNLTDPDTGGAGWQMIGFGQTYAGNPNGNVAGTAVASGAITQSILWDTVNNQLWACTTSGSVTTAVWSNASGLTVSDFLGSTHQLLAGEGYQKFPGGMILQWGLTDPIPTGSSGGVVTFPITFPNACLNVVATFTNSAAPSTGANMGCNILSTTAVNFIMTQQSGVSSQYLWHAVGH